MAGRKEEIQEENDQSCSVETTDNSQCDENGQEFPVIFQCTKCNAIVGDSTGWVSADEDLRTVTLSKMQHPTFSDRMETSRNGKDAGSTYKIMLCQECRADLGKMYYTTPQALDSIREMYTFNVDAIKSYTVGLSDSQTAPGAEAMKNLNKSHGIQNLSVQVRKRFQALEEDFQNSSQQFVVKRKRRDFDY